MSNDLKWVFGPSAAEEHGPKDSITTTFKGDKYYSLAREVIQNSLDAINDKSLPVKVVFKLTELQKKDLYQLWDLKKRFELCTEYYSTDKSFKKFCELAQLIFENDKIKGIKISDFNTLGLEYSQGTDSKFYAFMKAVGVTNKSSSAAGGSFGFGKGAYYAASSVRTIFVSSIYQNNKFIFQGKARLTTHKNESGALCDYTGHLGDTNGHPILDISLVPEILRRNEKGTDIIIIGFQDASDWKEKLIKSVLNNFWLSIWENKLIVEVDGTIINNENLERIIGTYYNEDSLEGSVNDPETWNPYPYFKAVKYKGDTNTEFFEKTFDTIGKVKLYLYKKEGLPNKIVYMRSPKMSVFKKTDNRLSGYVGVFVGDDESVDLKGNFLLREMENPQHNEWKTKNFLDDDKPHPLAILAENELKQFISSCLDSLMSSQKSAKQKILGLDKFLSIPEDLIPENEGEGEATGGGNISTEKSEEETAIESTEKEKENTIILEVKKKSQITNIETGTVDPDGDTTILTGIEGFEDGPPGPPSPPGPVPGPNLNQGTENGKEKIKKVLNIKYRVIAQKKSTNEIEHILKIFSDKDAKGEIELFAGVDNEGDSDDGMLTVIAATKDAQNLIANGNKIKNVSLTSGWNILSVKFDSNQKHSLKIKSYEV